ncbi:unnamed protein product, partial [Rotaria sp. Silwood1]
MPLNWQRKNWSEGYVYGQQMPLQPPPFYCPMDNLTMNKSSSIYNRKNQVQSHSVTSYTPRRGILKQTEKWRTPMTRRLVHFMPERWQGQEPVANNMTSHEYRGMSVMTPIPVNKKSHNSNVGSGPKRSLIKKTPEKAHLDTLRRRARRQKQRAALLEKSTELRCLKDNNRFSLLSEIDDDNNDDYTTDNSEADNQIEAIKDSKKIKQKNLSKKQKRQARTTTEVPIVNEHVVVNNNRKMRRNNQRQINFSDSEKEEEEENDNEKSPSLNKEKRKCKSYLQTFKILAYLKDRVNKDNKIKLDFKDVFNEVCEYAKNTIETYDSWVHNHYEAQVWQHIYDLG